MSMSPKKAMQNPGAPSGRGGARALDWTLRPRTQAEIDTAQECLPPSARIDRKEKGEDQCEE